MFRLSDVQIIGGAYEVNKFSGRGILETIYHFLLETKTL